MPQRAVPPRKPDTPTVKLPVRRIPCRTAVPLSWRFPIASTITASPSCRSPERTVVKFPSLIPVAIATRRGFWSLQDPDALLLLPVRPGRGLRPPGRRPAFSPVGHLVRGPLEPERGVRDLERTRSRGGDDRDIRRHARLQFSFRIGHLDHHVIGDDVLDRYRRIPDLRYLPGKRGHPGRHRR